MTLDDGVMSVVIGADRKIDGATAEQRWAQRWMVIREEYQQLQQEVAALRVRACVGSTRRGREVVCVGGGGGGWCMAVCGSHR